MLIHCFSLSMPLFLARFSRPHTTSLFSRDIFPQIFFYRYSFWNSYLLLAANWLLAGSAGSGAPHFGLPKCKIIFLSRNRSLLIYFTQVPRTKLSNLGVSGGARRWQLSDIKIFTQNVNFAIFN
jgi:hypothetical protein